jgi:hypothetical protein
MESTGTASRCRRRRKNSTLTAFSTLVESKPKFSILMLTENESRVHTMRDLRSKMTAAPVVMFRNLHGACTEEQLSDFLWRQVGVNVPPENISVKQHDKDRASAIVVFDRECLADFFGRALENLSLDGRRLYCLPPVPTVRKMEK